MSRVATTTVSISEKTLSWAWGHQCLHRERLAFSDGRALQVVYPGWLNSEDGPDFRGAILALDDGALLQGDVELHLRSSDWQGHGHQRDRRYNEVVAHVVVDHDQQGPALRADGRPVLTLVVAAALAGTSGELALWASLEQAPEQSCGELLARLGPDRAVEVIEAAGVQRFRRHAEIFAAALESAPAGQVLYAGIMEALGYSRNKGPFRRLAEMLPLDVMEGYAQGKAAGERLPLLQALLSGTAGLLPYGGLLPPAWHALAGPPAMDRCEWRLFRVRPENHPARRLVAAAHLIDRWLERGLVEGLVSLLPEGWPALEGGLMVHGPRDGGRRQPALLGRARAREIAVNVVLPFARAWARSQRRPDLSRQAGRLYRGYPALEENRATREMIRKLTGRDSHAPWRTACRQQGLIHIMRTYCERFRCSRCPLVMAVGSRDSGRESWSSVSQKPLQSVIPAREQESRRAGPE